MLNLCVENYKLKFLKILVLSENFENLGRWMEGWMDGWMGGWLGGWMEAKAGLRIAYSNQKMIEKDQN